MFPQLPRIRARESQRLVGASALAALLFAACGFPQYEVLSEAVDHCKNALFDGELGETDFDCGGGCSACALGRRCAASADCADGSCSQGVCVASGCTNQVKDGSETDTDCGGGSCLGCSANQLCAAASDCNSLRCEAGRCLAAACDDGIRNGRETDVDCGNGCQPCTIGRACFADTDCQSAHCEQGVCAPQPLVCPPGRADCDGEPSNGCECTTSPPEDECTPGYRDCNQQPGDGCESQSAVDDANCGACGNVCPVNTSCVDGECESGEPTGPRAITVATSGAHGMDAWSGSNSNGSIVSVDHTLSYARGEGRVLLLGISSFGTGAGPFTATYDDKPMQLAIELEHPSRQSYAAIYYLLDDQLPAPGSPNRARVVFNPKAWWGLGGFDVVELQHARQQKPSFSGTAFADTCSSVSTRGVRLDYTSPGALVYAVLSAHGNSNPPALLQSPPLTATWGQHVSNGNGNQTGSAAWILDDDTRSVDWATPTCFNSAAVGVVVERELAPPAAN